MGDYQLTAESNYSFHDTYSQFYLLGSNVLHHSRNTGWRMPICRCAPAAGTLDLDLVGPEHFQQELRRDPELLPAGHANVAQAGEPATFGIRFSYKY